MQHWINDFLKYHPSSPFVSWALRYPTLEDALRDAGHGHYKKWLKNPGKSGSPMHPATKCDVWKGHVREDNGTPPEERAISNPGGLCSECVARLGSPPPALLKRGNYERNYQSSSTTK